MWIVSTYPTRMVSYMTGIQQKRLSSPHSIHPEWRYGPGSLWPIAPCTYYKSLTATSHAGPRPTSGKLRPNLHGTILEGKSIGLDPKKTELIRESSWFGEPRCKLVSKAGWNSRIQFASNETKLVLYFLDLGAHLKWALAQYRVPPSRRVV
jgi:hypothetical protein